jgi:hypothetical protein
MQVRMNARIAHPQNPAKHTGSGHYVGIIPDIH